MKKFVTAMLTVSFLAIGCNDQGANGPNRTPSNQNTIDANQPKGVGNNPGTTSGSTR